MSAKHTDGDLSTVSTNEELLSKMGKREGQLTYAQLAVLGQPFLSSGGFAINKGGVVSTRPGDRPSITARGVSLHAGRWYFEVSVITPGRAVVGWGDALYQGSSEAARGVGDCDHSWGLDGHDMQLRYTDKANKEKNVACSGDGSVASWASGDVVGCYVSIGRDAMADMSFYLNGHLLDMSFHGVSFARGLRPVVSFDRQFTFVLNFGMSPFRCFVPNRARSVHHWARQKVRLRCDRISCDLACAMLCHLSSMPQICRWRWSTARSPVCPSDDSRRRAETLTLL